MSENAPRTDGRLPLIIVSGFLGAGKSTWLRHQLYENRFGRVHVLVNEAAETPVDDLLLSRANGLEALAGGCACCEGREVLRAALVRLCGRLDSGRHRIDRVVLETSGLADAGAIAEALAADPVLARRLAIESTIVLIDGDGGPDQLAKEPLARAQAEAADVIVVTRADAIPRDRRSALAATLSRLAPGAELSWTESGVPVAVEIDPDAEPLPLPEITADAGPIRPHRLDTGGAPWVAMSAWLSALLVARGDGVIRVKGVMRTPAGRLLLQSVRKHVQPAEILPERAKGPALAPEEDDFLVLIGRDIDEERLLNSWRRFVLG